MGFQVSKYETVDQVSGVFCLTFMRQRGYVGQLAHRLAVGVQVRVTIYNDGIIGSIDWCWGMNTYLFSTGVFLSLGFPAYGDGVLKVHEV